MEFRQIQYFLAASDHMSFTRAAEAIGVTQPALTTAIKKLEEELGGQLFLREGRGIELTPLGDAMRHQLSRIIEMRNAVKETAANIIEHEMETLNIGVMCTVGPNCIVDAISRWAADNPKIELILHDVWAERGQEMLLSGVIDCAVLGVRQPLPRRFETRRLFEEPFMLVMANDHPLAAQETISFDDFKAHNYINRLRCEFRHEFAELITKRNIRVESMISAEREDWVKSVIESGYGVTIAPRGMFQSAKITWREIETFNETREIRLTTLRNKPMSDAMTSMSTYLQNNNWQTPQL